MGPRTILYLHLPQGSDRLDMTAYDNVTAEVPYSVRAIDTRSSACGATGGQDP